MVVRDVLAMGVIVARKFMDEAHTKRCETCLFVPIVLQVRGGSVAKPLLRVGDQKSPFKMTLPKERRNRC